MYEAKLAFIFILSCIDNILTDKNIFYKSIGNYLKSQIKF